MSTVVEKIEVFDNTPRGLLSHRFKQEDYEYPIGVRSCGNMIDIVVCEPWVEKVSWAMKILSMGMTIEHGVQFDTLLSVNSHGYRVIVHYKDQGEG